VINEKLTGDTMLIRTIKVFPNSNVILVTFICPADDPLVYLVILFCTKGTSVVLGNGMKNVVFTDPESHQVREYNPFEKKNCDCYHSGSGPDCSEISASFFQLHGICYLRRKTFLRN